MAYKAFVCKVMIAGPNDVTNDKNAARKVIWEWNYQHSEEKKIVLMPVGWETHAAPAMGDRPQAIINKQVLEGCDLLIGIFWTHLGTPTGQAISGTVEEINEHLRRKRPAMLYFSSATVSPESLDPKEFERLQQFKKEWEKKSLFYTYADASEFKRELAKHLVKTVNDDEHFKKISKALIDSSNLEVSSETTPEQKLSKEARKLLLEATQDPQGSVLNFMSSSGLTIQANRKNVVTAPKDPRCQAIWQGALDELLENGLLADTGHEGESFRVTREGYALADHLKALG